MGKALPRYGINERKFLLAITVVLAIFGFLDFAVTPNRAQAWGQRFSQRSYHRSPANPSRQTASQPQKSQFYKNNQTLNSQVYKKQQAYVSKNGGFGQCVGLGDNKPAGYKQAVERSHVSGEKIQEIKVTDKNGNQYSLHRTRFNDGTSRFIAKDSQGNWKTGLTSTKDVNVQMGYSAGLDSKGKIIGNVNYTDEYKSSLAEVNRLANYHFNDNRNEIKEVAVRETTAVETLKAEPALSPEKNNETTSASPSDRVLFNGKYVDPWLAPAQTNQITKSADLKQPVQQNSLYTPKLAPISTEQQSALVSNFGPHSQSRVGDFEKLINTYKDDKIELGQTFQQTFNGKTSTFIYYRYDHPYADLLNMSKNEIRQEAIWQLIE